MQKNNGIDFDLQVKAMCEAASEPAPAGAWAAISSRVAASGAAGAAASRRVWGWTAAALAVAASLLLGIFLFNRSGSPSSVSLHGEDALLAQAEGQTVSQHSAQKASAAGETSTVGNVLTAKSLNDSELSGSAPMVKEGEQNHLTASASGSYLSGAAASEPALAGTRHAAYEPAAPAAQPATVSAQETSAPAAQPATQPENATTQPENTSVTQPANTAAAQPDPFALMAAEDARKARSRRPAALYVGGSVTNNNASAGAGAYAASGNRTGKGISETSKSTYSLPLSFGLGVSFPLNDRLSIATGLDYSLLSRTFAGTYTADAGALNADIRHTMQYIGIPVNLYCRLLDIGGLHLYGFAGAEAEYGISNKYTVYAPDKDIKIKEKVSGVQYSAAAGIGIEFRITDRIGLYLDPSARYYFDCRQPKSIRTEKPFLLVFDAGLRFNL